MKIVLIGAPGAGKGVYAQYFKDKYCIPHISTGDIFRGEIATGTELGLKIKPYVEKGLLVPDEIVIEVIKKRIQQPDAQKGFVLDGFPRTLNQARALDEITAIDAAIHLRVSEDIAVRRLSGRMICPVCGRIYNIYYEPKPKNDGQCDYDGAKLVRRRDDETDVVRQRYRVFYETFKPVLDYYKGSKKLIEVNADKSIGEIAPLLERILIEDNILTLKPCREVTL
ncbi:MAG: nucleoside monophosphate kinase [Thermosphaera sp.]|nr:nucleoside monophosphate kinase [Thermosphaera sp.]